MDLTLTDTQQSIRKLAADFVEAEIMPDIRDWDRAETVDTANIGRLGLLGLTIDERYGGTVTYLTGIDAMQALTA